MNRRAFGLSLATSAAPLILPSRARRVLPEATLRPEPDPPEGSEYYMEVRGVTSEEVYEHVRRRPPDFSCEAAEAEDVTRVRDVLQGEFKKYPRAAAGCGKAVLVVKHLSVAGTAYGGTYVGTTIILNTELTDRASPLRRVMTENELRDVFHHELSSIILQARVQPFPFAEWRALNPMDFSYTGSGFKAIRAGNADTSPEHGQLERGFLSVYSTSHIEEDVNIYVATMMCRPHDLRMFCRQYQAVAAKASLIREFYERVAPGIRETYPPAFWT